MGGKGKMRQEETEAGFDLAKERNSNNPQVGEAKSFSKINTRCIEG